MATIHVFSGQSIQTAIDGAAPGDTIIVHDGTYNENINITKPLTLLSENGHGSTIIAGADGSGLLGTIHIAPGVNNVTIGGIGQGFTVVGYDAATPGIEHAAIYLQGAHADITIQGNNVVANGEGGLLSEFGAAISNIVVDSNIFSGQTFAGPTPAGDGFTDQFTLPNVPRQLVALGTNSGAPVGPASNITFTNNQVTGTAGGFNASGNPQGNTLVTIDAANSTIANNEFTGFTNRFATQLRSREEDTDITNNTFSNASGGNIGVFVQDDGVPGTVSGNQGSMITGTPGVDSISGTTGDDLIIADPGNDSVDGLAGNDTYDMVNAGSGGSYVDLDTGIALSTITGIDTLTSIENVRGSAGIDTLKGNAGDNVFYATAGNDDIDGRGGSDTYDITRAGGNGSYVDLAANLGFSGATGFDTLTGIENIRGSAGDDILYGDANDNVFFATGGNDAIDGRGGVDTYDASNAATAVSIDLSSGAVSGAFNGTLTSIENAIGGVGNDSFTSGAADNRLDGGEGSDTAIYAADLSSANFSYDTINARWSVTAAGEGTDQLVDIEKVSDGGETFLLVGGGGFASIQEAIDAASAGDTILIAEGTYVEDLSITKGVTLKGMGDVTIQTATANPGNAVTVSGNLGGADLSIIGIDIVGAQSTPNQGMGVFVQHGANVGTLTLDDVEIRDAGAFGLFVYADDENPGTAPTNTVSEVIVTNSDFSHNGYNGANGSAHIKLFGFEGDATLQNLTLEGGTGGVGPGNVANLPDYGIEISGISNTMLNAGTPPVASPPIGNITIDNVTVSGDYHKNALAVFNFGDVNDLSIVNVDLTGAVTNWGPVFNVDGIAANVDASGYGLSLPTNTVVAAEIQGEKTQQGSFDSTLTGTAFNDHVNGKTGNDTLNGGAGNDVLNGGTGTDTAVNYDSSYSLSIENDRWVVKNGSETDVLLHVEKVVIDGQTFILVDKFTDGGFDTIQAAIDAAAPGDKILIAEGVYNENLTIGTDGLTLQGLGNVVLMGNLLSQLGVPNGTPLNDFFEQNHPAYSASLGIAVNADDITITGLTITGFSEGLALNTSDGVTIADNTFIDNVTGIRKGTAQQVTDLTVNGNTFTQGIHGMTIYAASNGDGAFDDIVMNNNTFSQLSEKGMYFEQLSNASLSGNMFDDVGNYGRVAPPFGPGSQNGEFGQAIDINLKYETYSNVTFADTTITNSGNSDQDGNASPGAFGAAIGVKIRDDAPSYHTVPADFTGQIVFNGLSIDGTSTGVRVGEPGKNNGGPDVLLQNLTIANATVTDVENATHATNGGTTTVVLSSTQQDLDASASQADVVVTGNGLDNDIETGSGDDTLTGGGGHDTLDGGQGADTMTGNDGDDTYYADAADTIIEAANEGTDHVLTSESHTLAANVENLTLLDGNFRTENFENFALGPIADGENGWKFAGTADQEIVDLGGNQVFRMSSDPTSGAFGGPYSPALTDTAGEPQTTADFSSQVIRFNFKAVDPVADNSRLEVDFGRANGTDRNNFMVIESIAGSGIRIAVNQPTTTLNQWANNTFTAFTGNVELISGVDASQWHQLELRLTYVDGPDNDIIDVYLNGQHIGVTTTFENFRDWSVGPTHADNAEANQTSRVFFRNSASTAPNDGPGGDNEGFYFDELTYGVYNDADATGNELENVIAGNSGSNVIDGMAGADHLIGNDGHDTLIGGADDDTLEGGSGNDTAHYAVGDGRDTFDGGDGDDTQVVNGTAAAEVFNLNAVSGTQLGINIAASAEAATLANSEIATTAVEEIVLNTGDGDDTVIVSGDLSGTGVAMSTVVVNGGADDDTVDASTLASAHGIAFHGNAGDDTFISSNSGGNDLFDGGADGANGDTVDYSAVTSGGVAVNLSTQSATGAGNDTLVDVENVVGTAFTDILVGDGDANTFVGGGGNDDITGGGSSDTAAFSGNRADYRVDLLGNGDILVTDLRGGANDGVDTLRQVENFQFANGLFTAATVLNDAPTVANPIDDQQSQSNAFWSFQVPANTFADVDSGVLTYSASLDSGDPLPAWLTFDAGTRTFSGTPPRNFAGTLDLKVTASDGTATGSDTFALNIPVSQAPELNLTQNADNFTGDNSGQIINGLAGNDTITGGLGNDRINGGDGNDTIDGGGGQNVVNGDAGNDYLTAIGNLNVADGGTGADQLFFIGNQNQLFGGDGNDWLGVNGNNNALVGAAGDDWIGASGMSNTIAAGDGNDTAFAFGTNNYLYGQTGNDWVGVSGSGNFLFGGDGNDYVAGTGDNNTFDGGAGNDTLEAAAANVGDKFIFHAGYGQDTIIGFNAGVAATDTVDLRGFGLANLAALTPFMSQVGADTVITLNGSDILTLRNVTLGALTPDDFILV